MKNKKMWKITKPSQKFAYIKHSYPIRFCEICGMEIEKFRKSRSTVCCSCAKLINKNKRHIKDRRRCLICLAPVEHGRYCGECNDRIEKVRHKHPQQRGSKIYIYNKD